MSFILFSMSDTVCGYSIDLLVVLVEVCSGMKISLLLTDWNIKSTYNTSTQNKKKLGKFCGKINSPL